VETFRNGFYVASHRTSMRENFEMGGSKRKPTPAVYACAEKGFKGEGTEMEDLLRESSLSGGRLVQDQTCGITLTLRLNA